MTPPSARLILKDGRSYSTAAELAAALRDSLSRGEVKPGEQLTPIRELVRQSKLSYSTVNRAVGMLAAEGLVEQRQGAGTFVCEPFGLLAGAGAKAKRIGVVFPIWGDRPNHFVASVLLHGICSQADKDHHRIEIVHTEGEEWTRYRFADKILSRDLDGVIWVQPILGSTAPLIRVLHAGLPSVVTGRKFVDLPVPSVHEDLAAMGELVADWMESNGRRHLICMVGRRIDLYSAQRVNAVRAALERRGMTLPDSQVLSAFVGDSHDLFYGVEWEDVIEKFLERNSQFDAVFSLYEESLGSLVALHLDGVKTCPDDFVLLHVDQSPRPARDMWPQLTMDLIRNPLEAIGRQAVRVLEGQMGLSPEPAEENLNPTLDCAARLAQYHADFAHGEAAVPGSGRPF